MNSADCFMGRIQELVKEYVVGTQHDQFLCISYLISKLDEEIQNISKEERCISKYFSISTRVVMLCDDSHGTLILPDPVMTVSIPFTTYKEHCILPNSFNDMYRRNTITDYECSMCYVEIASRRKETYAVYPNLLMCHLLRFTSSS